MKSTKKILVIGAILGLITSQRGYATLMKEDNKKEGYNTTQKALIGAAVLTSVIVAYKCLKSNPVNSTNPTTPINNTVIVQQSIQSTQTQTVEQPSTIIVHPPTLVINNNYDDSESDSNSPESPANSYTPNFGWEYGGSGPSEVKNDDDQKSTSPDNDTHTGWGYGGSESRGDDTGDNDNNTSKSPDTGWGYGSGDDKKDDDNSNTKSEDNDSDKNNGDTYTGTGYGDSYGR